MLSINEVKRIPPVLVIFALILFGSFRLTGMTGKYELGEFPISGDDFTQVLKIPADAPPGSYRLTVEGGDKSAKVVITIN
jgi:hypothetical protein